LARVLDTLAAWLEADPSPAEVMGSAATWDGWADASAPAGAAAAARRKGAADRDSIVASRRREVVIVCATAGSSYSTTVRCRARRTEYDLDHEQEDGEEEEEEGPGAAGAAREVVITQLCVGPLVALPVDDALPTPPPAAAAADGGDPERGDSYLFSSARKFIVTHHHAALAAAHAGGAGGAMAGHWLAGTVRHAPTCAIVEMERTVRTYHVTDPLAAAAAAAAPPQNQPQQQRAGNDIAVATVKTYARLAGRADVEMLTMRRSQLTEGTWLQVRGRWPPFNTCAPPPPPPNHHLPLTSIPPTR
jgi:hypothetical protein